MELLISSEKNYKKIRAGTIQFNPLLSRLDLHSRFWHKVIYFRQKQYYDKSYIDIMAVIL